MPHPSNTLYYGDNLPALREYVPDASVDLIYLDPPFNSNRSYNVLFKDEHGAESQMPPTSGPFKQAQREAPAIEQHDKKW